VQYCHGLCWPSGIRRYSKLKAAMLHFWAKLYECISCQKPTHPKDEDPGSYCNWCICEVLNVDMNSKGFKNKQPCVVYMNFVMTINLLKRS